MIRVSLSAAALAAILLAAPVAHAKPKPPAKPTLAQLIDKGTTLTETDAQRLVAAYDAQGFAFRENMELVGESNAAVDVVVCNFSDVEGRIDIAPDTPRNRRVNAQTCAPFLGLRGLGATVNGSNQGWNGVFLWRRAK